MPVISRWCNCESKGWLQKRLHADWISRNARYRDGSRLEPFRKPKSGARGRVPLTHLLPTSLSVGKRESELALRSGAKSRTRATLGHSEVCIGTWKRVTQAEVRATASPSRLQKFSATTAVWLGCRVTLRLLLTSNERIWPPFAKSAQPS